MSDDDLTDDQRKLLAELREKPTSYLVAGIAELVHLREDDAEPWDYRDEDRYRTYCIALDERIPVPKRQA